MNERRESAAEPGPSSRTAVMSSESADFVVRRLFAAGLALGSSVGLLDDARAKRVTDVISELDEIGRDVRRTALLESGEDLHSTADSPRQSLLAGMNHVLGEITARLDVLGRSDTAEEVGLPHLLDAVQNLERALEYLSEEPPCHPPNAEAALKR